MIKNEIWTKIEQPVEQPTCLWLPAKNSYFARKNKSADVKSYNSNVATKQVCYSANMQSNCRYYIEATLLGTIVFALSFMSQAFITFHIPPSARCSFLAGAQFEQGLKSSGLNSLGDFKLF